MHKKLHSMKQYDLFDGLEKKETLEILNKQIRNCKRCKLHTTRKYALIGEGNLDARIMFVALAPGVKEDSQNRMFIGPSGQVFNRLLHTAGIDRKSVFMTNLVKCLLPKNRKPNIDEIESCSQFLFEEISIVEPEIIVPLGAFATQAIITNYQVDPLSVGISFTKINGTVLLINNKKIFPLPHPASLLYNPSFETDTIKKYIKLKTYM